MKDNFEMKLVAVMDIHTLKLYEAQGIKLTKNLNSLLGRST